MENAKLLPDDLVVDNVSLEFVADVLEVKDAGVAQAKLKTAIGEVSISNTNILQTTLPGGTYGFYPQIKKSIASAMSAKISHSAVTGTTYLTRLGLGADDGGTAYAQQRYITASGKDHWIFLIIDKVTKKLIGGYQAPDHPCANQGELTELELPHPFLFYDENIYEIICADNFNLAEIRQKVTSQKSLLQVINEDYIIDLDSIPIYKEREIIKHGYSGVKEKRMVKNLPNNIKFKKLKTR